jgi:hypothetical protein
MLLDRLKSQNENEVKRLRSTMITQLQKNVHVEKMPSVRVRPTLRVELKHRVLNQKIPKKM